MININDLNVNRVGPVEKIEQSEIGNKYQSRSGLNFGELVLAEVLKNKKPEEKKVEKEPETSRDNKLLDDMKASIAASYSIMNSFLIKNQKKGDKNDRSK